MSFANIVPQGVFGPGILIATRTDIPNGTPFNVGFVQEFSTDMKFELKELYGQNQFPLLVARGTAKCTGKIKAATLSSQSAINLVFGSGASVSVGTQYDMSTTASTAIPTTPFQITPTVPNSGTWSQDLGVTNAATGEPLTQVASGPAAGQYSVSAGVYTFSSADHTAGVLVIINFAYFYTTGATGQTIAINNTPIGTTPSLQLDYKSTLYGATYYLRLLACVGGGWVLNHKLTDFVMPEYEFGFFANASQSVGFISLATQA